MGCGTSNRLNQNISENVKKAQIVAFLSKQEEHEKALYDRDVEKEGQLQSNRKGKPINIPKESLKNHWIFQVEQTVANETFIVKPWRGILKVPDDFHVPRQESSISLDCEYVYGYQCLESRNNLFFTDEAQTVVFAAGIFGVVFNYSSNSQLLYKNHQDEIVALCVHKETHTVATGDKRYMICVWDCKTLKTFTQHKTQVKGTLSLSFCPNNDLLAVLSGDFRLTVYEWKNFSSLFSISFDSVVFFLAVHSKKLLSCVVGRKFVAFVSESGEVEKAVFGNKGKVCTMTSAVWWDDICLTAASNGQVYRWEPPKLDSAFQVFELGVTVHALKVLNGQVFCAGADRTLVVLGTEMQILHKCLLSSYAKAIDGRENKVLLGLSNGSLVVVEDEQIDEVFFGFSEEIVEIVNISKNLILVAVESEVRVINYLKHQEVAKISQKTLFESARSIEDAAEVKINAMDFSCVLNHIALSIGTGFLSVFSNENSIRNFKFLKISQNQVNCLKYSPNSSFLVCSSSDSVLILETPSYSIKTSWAYSAKVRSIDWNKHSTFFQTNAENFDLKFWNLDAAELHEINETLNTWTSRVGWPFKNLKESFVDLPHITTVKSDPNFEMIAVGDDWGSVNLLEVLAEKGVKVKCHASHVRALIWAGRNDLILSGGNHCVVETRLKVNYK